MNQQSPQEIAQEPIIWTCRFHPIDWWHEIGCPHQEWTKEQLQSALETKKRGDKLAQAFLEQRDKEHAAELERLKRVLQRIRTIPAKPFPDAGAHSWEAFGIAVWRAWSDIQRIAAEVLNSPAGSNMQGVRDSLLLKPATQPQSVQIEQLSAELERLRETQKALVEALKAVDALIVCTDVRMDAGPHFRLQTTGQHEAASLVRAVLALVKQEPGIICEVCHHTPYSPGACDCKCHPLGSPSNPRGSQ